MVKYWFEMWSRTLSFALRQNLVATRYVESVLRNCSISENARDVTQLVSSKVSSFFVLFH